MANNAGMAWILTILFLALAVVLCFTVTGWQRIASFTLLGMLAALVAAGVMAGRRDRTSGGKEGQAAVRDDPGEEGDRLVIISPHADEIKKEFRRAFEEKYFAETGRKIRVEYPDRGGTGQIVSYLQNLKREGKSIEIDIAWGGGPDPFRAYAAAGLLAKHKPPADALEQVPESLGNVQVYDPDGLWHGTMLSGFGIMVNKQVFKEKLPGVPVPKRWEDLRDPRLFGWVASSDPSASGSMLAAYEMLLQALGWEDGFAACCEIAGNVRDFGKGGSYASSAVASGVVAAGMCIDSYAQVQIDRVGADRLEFTMPERQTVLTPDPIALFDGAPHAEAARRFIDFTLSLEGQKLLYLKKGTPGGPQTDTLYRLPVRRDLYGRGLPAFTEFDPFRWRGFGMNYDMNLAKRRRGILGDLFKAAIIDVHTDLKAAWKRVIDSGMDPELRQRFGAPTETLDRLLELSDTTYKTGDADERARVRADWTAQAKRKFENEDRKGDYALILLALALLTLVGLAGTRWMIVRREGRRT
jgi:iron(III) transport system substrate-binding protein